MAQIVALCEKHRVMQLFVFGSVLTRRFNKNSDVHFTVVFDKGELDPIAYGTN